MNIMTRYFYRGLRTALILSTILLQANAVAAVEAAPEVKLHTDQGDVELSSLRGKVIYLDFWASWCKPCVKSFPWMHDMKQAYGDQGLEIVAVNVDSDPEAAQEFLDKVKVNFIVAYDREGEAATKYGLRGMPSTYLVGKDGKIYASHVGFRDKDKADLENVLKKLLQQ